MGPLLIPELAYQPDDEYNYGDHYKDANCHTGLENIAYKFAACQCPEQQSEDAQMENPVFHCFVLLGYYIKLRDEKRDFVKIGLIGRRL